MFFAELLTRKGRLFLGNKKIGDSCTLKNNGVGIKSVLSTHEKLA